MDLLTPSRKIPLVNLDVIGSRPEPIVPDGVWIEIQGKIPINEAVHNAQCEEERIKLAHQHKNAQLKKFQKDVQRRVTRAAVVHKKYINHSQTVKMEKEREVLYRSASAAERSTPKKNRCTYNVNPITIDCTGKLTTSTKMNDLTEAAKIDPVLHICSQRLESLTSGARQKLAERSIVPRREDLDKIDDGDAALPGGFWGVGASRDKSKARLSDVDFDSANHSVKTHDVDEELIVSPCAPSQPHVAFASGQKGTMTELSSSYERQEDVEENATARNQFDTKGASQPDLSYSCAANSVHFKLPENEFDQDDVTQGDLTQHSNVVTRSIPAYHGPDGNYNLDVFPKPKAAAFEAESAPPVVRPGAVAYNQKLADERARWLSRRVFADAERERSREHSRLKEHRLRVERLRAENEKVRAEIEEKSREQVEAVSLANEKLRKKTEKQERRIKLKKSKEKKQQQKTERFVSALRTQLKDRLKQNKIELPPLCMCGETFWDTNPETCANNCIFYRNPKAFAKALEAVLQVVDRNMGPFHKDALQRSTVSLPLAPDDGDISADITIPNSSRTLSARSDNSSLLSLGSLQ